MKTKLLTAAIGALVLAAGAALAEPYVDYTPQRGV